MALISALSSSRAYASDPKPSWLDTLMQTLPVHAVRVSGAMADLMEHGLVIAFRVLELGLLGQHNLVARHVVVGPVPVDFADLDPVRRNDILDVL